MEFLTTTFLGLFSLLYTMLYPIFLRPVFATYIVILVFIALACVKLYQYLKQQSFAKLNFKEKIKLSFLWSLQIYLTLMMFWYVFVHFKTHSIM